MKSRRYKLYRKIRQRMRNINAWIVDGFFCVYEALTGTLITYHVRPDTATPLAGVQEKNAYPRSAIVIQGPVVGEKNFTLETVRIYKTYFSDAIIILSTWDDTDANAYERIKKERIEIILNKKPEFAGYKNINFQIVSTAAGVARAQALGAAYILKTRTDQRFYNPHLLCFLYNTIEAFPISAGTQQTKRLIFSSASKRSDYRPYYASDMMVYGSAADMNIYWHPPQAAPESTWIVDAPEQYVMTEFLKKIGHQPTGTVDDSNRVFADYCVILDLPMFDFYWYKYERRREYKDSRYEKRESHNLSFLEWLGLYAASKREN